VGLFKKITRVFTKATAAVVTGGLSLVAPKLVSPITRAVETIYNPKNILGVASAFAPGIARPVAAVASSVLYPQKPTAIGGAPMGLNVGGILGAVGNIFGGAQNPYFQGVSNVAGLASQFFPQPSQNVPAILQPRLQATPTMAAVPALRAGAVVARGFFNRFPNLATAIQGFRNQGRNVKRSQLWSMLKRFGPDVLISGGILSAAAVSELMVAGPGHRRMNPGNVSALRRSLRRLESFHKLCTRADKLRRPRGSRKSCKTGGGSQFVRQG